MSANYIAFANQVTWVDPTRAGSSFIAQATTQTNAINLLNAGEKYGEGLRLTDLKFAKNIRFAGKRLNVGLDIYNLFNSDAALGYDSTYNSIVGGQSVVNANFWRVNNITSPRFARFQVQFDF